MFLLIFECGHLTQVWSSQISLNSNLKSEFGKRKKGKQKEKRKKAYLGLGCQFSPISHSPRAAQLLKPRDGADALGLHGSHTGHPSVRELHWRQGPLASPHGRAARFLRHGRWPAPSSTNLGRVGYSATPCGRGHVRSIKPPESCLCDPICA
jgi:hypothetical protein